VRHEQHMSVRHEQRGGIGSWKEWSLWLTWQLGRWKGNRVREGSGTEYPRGAS
jgi:hypothetical protein